MEWYYSAGGKQIGPVNENIMHQLIESGTVKCNTMVWREGMNDWKLASETELNPLFIMPTTGQEKSTAGDKKWVPGCIFAIAGMIGMFILFNILDSFFGFGLADTKFGIILLFAAIIGIGAWLISYNSGKK